MTSLPIALPAHAQDSTQTWRFPTTLGAALPTTLDSTASQLFLDLATIPAELLQPIEAIHVLDADLRDLFFALARRYNLNLLIDESIQQNVTIRLSDVRVVDALALLVQEYGLAMEQSGAVLRIIQPRPEENRSAEPLPPDVLVEEELPPSPADAVPELPPGETLSVQVENGLLTVQALGADVQVLAQNLSSQSGLPVVVGEGVSGAVSGALAGVPLEEGLRVLLENNGFYLGQESGTLRIEYPPLVSADPTSAQAQDPTLMEIQVEDGLLSLSVTDTPVLAVLQQLAQQSDLNIVTHSSPEAYGTPEARVSARLDGVTLEEALQVLLQGTNLTYRLEGKVLVVGDRQVSGMATSRLIRLAHISAEGIVERLPEALRQGAAFQLVSEQNGLVVTGPSDLIGQIEVFVREIDVPTPQILMEVLVVEFETTELKELGVTFLGGLLPPDANLPQADAGWKSYLFGGGSDQGGPLDVIGDATTANRFINFWTDLLGISSIGRLPSDFYFRLQALDRDGKATVRSRPHIVTLNGSPASITVGASQYYILKSAYEVQPGLFGAAEAERFERVDANVRLEITPWLNASGSITAEVRPSFATPVGTLDPRIPPAINTWDVNTVVRLQEGETILIGGLIQEKESVTRNKIPILGSIPLLGRLFRNSRTDIRTSELVIFLTPYVFLGDEEDAEKWNRLKKELNLPDIEFGKPQREW